MAPLNGQTSLGTFKSVPIVSTPSSEIKGGALEAPDRSYYQMTLSPIHYLQHYLPGGFVSPDSLVKVESLRKSLLHSLPASLLASQSDLTVDLLGKHESIASILKQANQNNCCEW